LVAFVSLGTQLRGLVGERGILPAAEFFERAHEALGRRALFELPSLFWLSSSDAALLAVVGAGAVASALLLAGWLEGPAIVVSWACYLSLCVAGQTFLSFQWDALLLETLLCAAFWASWAHRRSTALDPESAAGRWLVWALGFKLMFLSGVTKLLSGDPTWRDLSALTFHYQTQPLPSWVSWWAHRLPLAAQRGSVVTMIGIEMLLPLLLLSPWRTRVARRLAATGLAGLQLVIAWTGNYGFFNVLALALAVALVDDDAWRRLARRVPQRPASAGPPLPGRRPPRLVLLGAGALAALSLLSFVAEMQRTALRALPAGLGTRDARRARPLALDQRLRTVSRHDDRTPRDRGRGDGRHERLARARLPLQTGGALAPAAGGAAPHAAARLADVVRGPGSGPRRGLARTVPRAPAAGRAVGLDADGGAATGAAAARRPAAALPLPLQQLRRAARQRALVGA
jgi:hypothetical protein